MTNNGRVYNKEFKLETVRVIIEKGGGELLNGFQVGLRDLHLQQTLEENAKRFPDLKIETVEAALTLIRTAANLSKAFDRHFISTFSFTESRFDVLMLLYSEPQYILDLSVLCERAEKSKPTIKRFIDGLEKQGLVKRVNYFNRQRKQRVQLTSEGMSLLEQMLPSYYQVTDYLMSGLSASEQLQLTDLLNQLKRYLTDSNYQGNESNYAEI